MSKSISTKSPLISAIISGILSFVIFATLRFYAHWFNTSQINTLFGGYLFSWMFILSLTCVSNAETLVFGADFQAKLVPEILLCLIMTASAAGVVHRVCATTSIFFSLVGLYFINRISSKYYNSPVVVEDLPLRKSGKKNK
ncbi:protein KRTCAP2 homolog [Drosophila mojavensis]|uniref:Uncharacterized protein n=1 Tax=Drosophila mojavensis TaxID=7230 RepID=B4KD46_DROMO|nr:protein KRTCAP2 homolog [Drosophila mojavensis]EDW13816.2 uncharacterized protein Dmoj_GI23918 [Drosophila mojavensis]